MSEDLHIRINALEAQLKEVKTNNIDKATPMLGVFLFIAFILFIAVYANAPGIEDDDRFRAGIGFGFLGAMIYGGAYQLVHVSLKAIVEAMAALTLFVNMAIGAVIWPYWEFFEGVVIGMGATGDSDELTGLTILLIAVVMFIFNLFAFFVLIPMAKIAGTDINLE
tara:strand:- start:6679 stop:7176 length:498 start_codon:yes stop_codon:yes gene_type:complete